MFNAASKRTQIVFFINLRLMSSVFRYIHTQMHHALRYSEL